VALTSAKETWCGEKGDQFQSSNDSCRNDGGADCYSRYTCRGAAGMRLDGGCLDRQPLPKSVTAFTALAGRPAVWSRHTTECTINSVSGERRW
jgi:hypothetical protein